MSAKQWSLKQALTFWILSVGCTLVVFTLGYRFRLDFQKKRLQESRYHVVSIIQTGPEKEALKTNYLAELLGLAIDQPKSLYSIDLKQAQQMLQASPLIVRAELRRIPPNTLYIDYETRKPVAWLADYENTAIDREGYLFPVRPFISPKNLPEIYLGLPPFEHEADQRGREGGSWQKALKNPYVDLALEVLDFLNGSSWEEGLHIQRIDVSDAFAPSLGQREIVLFTEEEMHLSSNGKDLFCIFPKILRLSPKDYPQQMQNFFALQKAILADYRMQSSSLKDGGRFAPRIIDLRVPQLAFVQN